MYFHTALLESIWLLIWLPLQCLCHFFFFVPLQAVISWRPFKHFPCLWKINLHFGLNVHLWGTVETILLCFQLKKKVLAPWKKKRWYLYGCFHRLDIRSNNSSFPKFYTSPLRSGDNFIAIADGPQTLKSYFLLCYLQIPLLLCWAPFSAYPSLHLCPLQTHANSTGSLQVRNLWFIPHGSLPNCTVYSQKQLQHGAVEDN